MQLFGINHQREIAQIRASAKNALILGTGRGIDQGLIFLTFVLVGRISGVQHLGQLAFVFALTKILMVASGLGLNFLISREVARDPGLTNRYVNQSLLLAFSASVAFGLCLLLGLASASHSNKILAAAAFLCLARVFEVVLGVIIAAFRARGRFLDQSTCIVAGSLSTFILVLLSLRIGGSVIHISVAFLVGSLIALVVAISLYRSRLGVIRPTFDPGACRDLIRAAYPFWIVALLGVIHARSSPVLLNFFHGDEEVGIFAAAHSLVAGATILSGALVNSMVPALSRMYVRSIPRLHSVYRKSLLYLTLAGLPIALVMTLAAGPLIRLVYGPDFHEAAPVLLILAWAILFAFLSSLNSGFLGAANLQNHLMRIVAVGTSVNLGSTLLLIPTMGSVGAGVAVLFTYLVLFLLSYRRLRIFFGSASILEKDDKMTTN